MERNEWGEEGKRMIRKERDEEEDEGKDEGCRRDGEEQDTNWYTSSSIVILVPFSSVSPSHDFLSLSPSVSIINVSHTQIDGNV